MITFLWIFAAVILLVLVYFVANGANQRRRAGQAGSSEVKAEQDGGGAPKVGRAPGVN